MTKKRRSQIVSLIQEKGEARVDALATQFGVSEVTIRNDLSALADQGLVIRDHGGAIPASSIHSLAEFSQRTATNTRRKQRIGQAAAALVREGDTILIDAGTTAIEMVPFLERAKPSLVVTNALNVAQEVANKTSIDLLLIGGTFNRTAFSTAGLFAESTLRELNIDKLFLGTQAFTAERGLTDTTVEIAQVKRAMISAAMETIVVTDSSKGNKTGLVSVASWDAIDAFITDDQLPIPVRELLRTQTRLEIVAGD